MGDAVIGLVGVIAGAVIAQAELGGRRELRELGQLVEVAKSSPGLRGELEEAAKEALDGYTRRRPFRDRIWMASGALLAVVGLSLLTAVPTGEVATDVHRARTEMAVAVGALLLIVVGLLLLAGAILVNIWLNLREDDMWQSLASAPRPEFLSGLLGAFGRSKRWRPRAPLMKVVASLVVVLIIVALVHFATAQVLDLPAIEVTELS